MLWGLISGGELEILTQTLPESAPRRFAEILVPLLNEDQLHYREACKVAGVDNVLF